MPYNPKGNNKRLSQTDAGYTTLVVEGTGDVPQGYVQKNLAGMIRIFVQPLNILLVFVPLGIVAGQQEWKSLYIFSCNFVAIVPLASILGGATEALAGHTGQMIGGLLNATFGNAVEMIVTINAIRAGLVSVVQASLIGSVLSNLLLVLGMACVASNAVAKEATFNVTGAATNISCLVVASMALSLPTVFAGMAGTSEDATVAVSRWVAVVMIAVYCLFIVFQLISHAELFAGEEEEEEEPELDMAPALLLLFGATCTVAVCSEFLVDSIEGVSEKYGLPQAFIGTILLPIVGNAAEHTTAVTAAAKGKMDLALGVAVGSATQIALFVIPFSVCVGWVTDVNMGLDFEIFMTVVLTLSVFIAASVLGDGSANWFEGTMLVASYVMVAIICWFLPTAKEPTEAGRRLLSYKVWI